MTSAGTVETPIEWAGGECPVEPNALVKVQCAFETEFDYTQMPRRARAWADNWRRDPSFSCELAITHYLLVDAR